MNEAIRNDESELAQASPLGKPKNFEIEACNEQPKTNDEMTASGRQPPLRLAILSLVATPRQGSCAGPLIWQPTP
ncbi:hypothetical protein GCM10027082_31050 [Comamonas humi]